MPRPGPVRPQVAVRLSQTDLDQLDERARDEGVQRSELIRRLLKYATATMPRGWTE